MRNDTRLRGQKLNLSKFGEDRSIQRSIFLRKWINGSLFLHHLNVFRKMDPKTMKKLSRNIGPKSDPSQIERYESCFSQFIGSSFIFSSASNRALISLFSS